MNIIAIIQARMGSERLPGKVLKTINGISLLEYQINRIKHSVRLTRIAVATTNNIEDDVIAHLCSELGIECYRGPQDNVLKRYYDAACMYEADIIIRLTADCPLIDPNVIDRVIDAHLQSNVDYTSNTLKRTYPRGMDTEVLNFEVLEKAYKGAVNKHDLEHVTPFIYNNANLFRTRNVSYIEDCSKIRLTVDVQEDFELIKSLIEECSRKGTEFTLEEILKFLRLNPELVEINSDIEQKN